MPIRMILIVLTFLLLPSRGTANLIQNGSFESPSTIPGSFCTVGIAIPPTCASALDVWSAPYILGNGGGGLYGQPVPVPDGAQFLILQGNNGGTNMSQTVNLPSTGNYLLTWYDSGRFDGGTFGGNQTYELHLDGIAVGSSSTVDSQPWTFQSRSFFANAGLYTFSIVPLATTDETAFLDNFVLVAENGNSEVPEPASAAILALGLAAIVTLRRRG